MECVVTRQPVKLRALAAAPDTIRLTHPEGAPPPSWIAHESSFSGSKLVTVGQVATIIAYVQRTRPMFAVAVFKRLYKS
jgi:hypothetical protein